MGRRSELPGRHPGRPLKAKDAPGCLLPNGRVLCVAGPAGDGANDWPNPAMFFEFDGVNLNRVADPPNANTVIYTGRMLLLPTGEVLYAAGTPDVRLSAGSGRARRMETDRDRLPDRPAPRGQLHPVRDPAQWAIAGGQLWR